MDENLYDKWKKQSPEEIPENECEMCGAPCDSEFCSEECEKAWFED